MTPYEQYCDDIRNITRSFDKTSAIAICNYYGWKVERNGYIKCPFHNDQHPSCGITKNGYFHCFTCGETWSQPDIVMKMEGVGLTPAKKKIWVDILGNQWPTIAKRSKSGGDSSEFILSYDELRFIGLSHAMSGNVSNPVNYEMAVRYEKGDPVWDEPIPEGCRDGGRDADGGHVIVKEDRFYGLRDFYDEDPVGALELMLGCAKATAKHWQYFANEAYRDSAYYARSGDPCFEPSLGLEYGNEFGEFWCDFTRDYCIERLKIANEIVDRLAKKLYWKKRNAAQAARRA